MEIKIVNEIQWRLIPVKQNFLLKFLTDKHVSIESRNCINFYEEGFGLYCENIMKKSSWSYGNPDRCCYCNAGFNPRQFGVFRSIIYRPHFFTQ